MAPKAKGKPKAEDCPVLVLDQFPPYLFHLITSHLNNRLLERMRPHGVTVHRWRVLMVLMNDDGQTMSELVRMTLIAQSALSRVVDQMERDGLVKRRIGSHDNRVVEVYLTDHGRDTYCKIAPDAQRHGAEILEGLDPAEQEQLFGLLRRVLEAVSSGAAPAED